MGVEAIKDEEGRTNAQVVTGLNQSSRAWICARNRECSESVLCGSQNVGESNPTDVSGSRTGTGARASKERETRTSFVEGSMAKAEEQNPVLRTLKGIERSSPNPSIYGYIVSFTSTTRAKEGSQQTT